MHTLQKVTTSLWYFKCAKVMKEMAGVLNEKKYVDAYSKLENNIQKAFNDTFYDEELGSFGSQAANAMTLHFGVVEDEKRSRLIDALVADIQQRDFHLNVGVMGVRYIFEVLSQFGRGDLALKILEQDSYPSFGHLIERGATTLWECWGEKGHDRTHGPRSLNHPFMGGFDNWFFNTLGGIQLNFEHPGFSLFAFKPMPFKNLGSVKVNHHCVKGLIESAWEIKGNKYNWKGKVPAGSKANYTCPFTKKDYVLEPGNHSFEENILERP